MPEVDSMSILPNSGGRGMRPSGTHPKYFGLSRYDVVARENANVATAR